MKLIEMLENVVQHKSVTFNQGPIICARGKHENCLKFLSGDFMWSEKA